MAGVFPKGVDPVRNYFEMEERFLEFCVAIDEPPSRLDAIMWDYMRRIYPVEKKMTDLNRPDLFDTP